MAAASAAANGKTPSKITIYQKVSPMASKPPTSPNHKLSTGPGSPPSPVKSPTRSAPASPRPVTKETTFPPHEESATVEVHALKNGPLPAHVTANGARSRAPLSPQPLPKDCGLPRPLTLAARQNSLTSLTSTVTLSPSEAAARAERTRQTLGEILEQIKEKSNVLLSKTDFTTATTLPDLHYLAHQSRYNSDLSIKRKLVMRMVDCGALDIFLRVFHSVHTVDFLRPGEDQDPRTPIPDSESTHDVITTVVDNDDNASVKDVSIREDDRDRMRLAQRVPKSSDSFKNLKAASTFVLNCTDRSPTLCEDCLRRGVVSLLIQDLSNPQLSASELRDPHKLLLVKYFMGILSNIIRFNNEARDIFRDAGAVKVLQHYLRSTFLMVKTKTMLLLSYIMTESENDIINASDKNISFIIKMLQSSLDEENHYSKRYGHWAVEIAAGINRLAACESNKERLLLKGVLPLYVKLLQSCSEEEQLIAAQGLWAFGFCKQGRQFIRDEPGCIRGLEQLGKLSAREEIRKAAMGALWTIHGAAAYSVVFNGAEDTHERPGPSSGHVSHVMLSYQWSMRGLILRIRDRLKQAGYKLWCDADKPGNCSLEEVARAIADASVVVIGLSQKYKDSPTCRSEVEYAMRLQKDIVPLRLQPRYNADGWLLPVLGAKSPLDFSTEESLESMLPNLIRQLGSRGRVRPPEAPPHQSPPALRVPTPVSTSSSSLLSGLSSSGGACSTVVDAKARCSNWSTSDVAKWLHEAGLDKHKHRFDNVTGDLLLELRKMYKNAPESFYSCSREQLKLDLVSTLKLTRALDRL